VRIIGVQNRGLGDAFVGGVGQHGEEVALRVEILLQGPVEIEMLR